MTKYESFIATVSELIDKIAVAKGKDQQYKIVQLQMYIRGFQQADAKQTNQENSKS